MRILLTRTDRIGDVVLSTPVIKAMRDSYPDAHIAFMVRPYAEALIDGNPYLDEVIIYDKYGKDKSFLNTIKFAFGLKKKKFDLAIMLHPTNRVHIMAFLAGIPKRIGYDRKFSFLLTKKVPHTKQEGRKHESEYTFDLLKEINIKGKPEELFVPLHKKDLDRVDELFQKNNLNSTDTIITVNPGASCISKKWPADNFANLSDELISRLNAKIIIVTDKSNIENAAQMEAKMQNKPINLAGKTTVGELAVIISKSSLFISNDSGPVHIAAAVGTPVISIFGRKDPGLSPKRWGPLSKKAVVFHKDVGCKVCLAHNCQIGFKCLEAIAPDEVLPIAMSFLTK